MVSTSSHVLFTRWTSLSHDVAENDQTRWLERSSYRSYFSGPSGPDSRHVRLESPSSIFLKTLADAGITHAFVNWGSDHPGFLEDLERQRTVSRSSAANVNDPDPEGEVETKPTIITCPNEFVALCAAQGYAQVTGRPAALLVHVDVGTQALGGAIHNVDRCRTPVVIYAGAAPYTHYGEMKGSRNEFIMTYQDIPDQTAMVRQYMRQTTQLYTAKNSARVLMNTIKAATSEPKGPVYIYGRREAMEEEVDEDTFNKTLDIQKYSPLQPGGLAPSVASVIANAIASAKFPLIITGYLGRNTASVGALVALSDALTIAVYLACPSVLSFPTSHPHFVGLSYGMSQNTALALADVILVIDADIPWIPVHNTPRNDARIFHIDIDPLKPGFGAFHIPAEITARADGQIALSQIFEASPPSSSLDATLIAARKVEIGTLHARLVLDIDIAEQAALASPYIRIPSLIAALRVQVPERTLVLNESITNFEPVWAHLRPTRPGSVFTSGGSCIGWALGAAIGACLGNETLNEEDRPEMVMVIVGDGSYLEGVPGSAFWIARRYKTPFLTVILNNGGWNAPIRSMLGVYASGLGSQAPQRELTTSFGPQDPDYAQLAVAAGGAWGRRVERYAELKGAIGEAVRIVREERRCAVLDCVLEERIV